ncbi:TPA: autotransporter outer membrane beta-barrel domain-containing protein [Yersinia enterocolitica]|uniref:autotransporter outer membrane beta-barrel domain-containing protein n=1 Tax=Yersinia enterocolitica TaxID=630 RepID=UPI003303A9CA|nr:autotransporter outer membrane beta-barrel domain-containing protein [Yersinia enterocolitica]HDL6969393.1 autotransporter outer membrane beta-barrel domain-containing protein [Yersinia enterocolitica]HDL6973538.1 autotransporter outer membrane beta-barrel domain-containing protein [Yersinia enterocolitica]HDL6994441.1 autotransporter outer membrane beta-barrel domain-containing protein [Yersinia enterocolitica]HDL7093417.1 autotransporter outer membrane beta-barrel domain-containing protein
MLNSTTLNTRLLPLSILISSLVSGGAIAAAGDKFDESKYTPVTAGSEVTDENKWSASLKKQISDIQQNIKDLNTKKTENEELLTKDKIFTDHKETLAQLKDAVNDKQTADNAVTDSVKQVKTDIEALAIKKGTDEKALVGVNSDNHKAEIENLIKGVRDTQKAYHDALKAEKDKVKDDAKSADFTDIATTKQAFKDAVNKLENEDIDSGNTLKKTYATELDAFYNEIGFTANETELDNAQKEVDVFKALVAEKETAADDVKKFDAADTYLKDPTNATNKLAPEKKIEATDFITSAPGKIKSLEDKEVALIPTQGIATVAANHLAKNEIVDTLDQTIQAGGASLGNHIISKTQTVAKDAIAINSTVTGTDGKQVLEVGAKSDGTIVNDAAVLENNGGEDHNSVINKGGQLVLAGTKDNLAKSVSAKVLEGGAATVGEFAKIVDLYSTKGTIKLDKGAQASFTTIDDGTLTIAAGAKADNTTLSNATLDLVEGATADNTTLQANSAFTLKDKAITAGTTLHEDSSVFAVEDGATAKSSFVIKGTMTLNSGAKAEGIELHKDGHLDIKDGAHVVNTTLKSAQLKLGANAQVDGTNVTADSTLTLLAGAQTKDTIVTEGGQFIVNAQAIANNTKIISSYFDVEAGATANTTTVDGGKFDLSGSAENTVLNDGEFIVNIGSNATNTTVNGGKFNLSGTADKTTLIDGDFIVNAGATANNTTVKGSAFNLMEKAQASKLMVDHGKVLIAGKLNDATFIDSAAAFDKTAKVSGLINIDAKSNVAVLDGATTKAADLNLAGNMLLLVGDMQQLLAANTSRAASHRAAASNPAQFAFKNVTLKGGTIDMSHSDSQLAMASLAGQGTFNLGSALYNQASAPLHVTGDADGEFALQINNHNNGVAPTNLNVIDVDGTNGARFTLANGPVDLGNYKHSLVSDGKGGYRLVADKTAVTAGVAAVMAVANTMPVIFNAELSSIQNHLDKQTTDANESGVWLTYLNDNYKVKGTAANFDQKLNGVTLGGDKAIEVGDAVVSVGSFASHSSSNIKSDYQSSGSVESNSLGAYAQYLSNGGYYFNSVLKINQFKQNLSVTSLGHSVNGSTNLSGMGVALKAGKQFNINDMYFSPYAALSSFSSGKSQYKLSNGMAAQNQGAHTTTGTIGMNTGYRYVLNSGVKLKPYTTFSLDHDFVANEKIMINNEMFNNSRKGSRANAGVGINVNLTKNLSIGSEVKFSKGKNIETPMTINMGVGYTF